VVSCRGDGAKVPEYWSIGLLECCWAKFFSPFGFGARLAMPRKAMRLNPGNHPIERFALKGQEIITWKTRVLTAPGVETRS
jgi:hypothetical protein